jgi:hypothetical protein
MCGDDDELAGGIELRPGAGRQHAGFERVADVEDGVDARISGDEDSIGGDTLGGEHLGSARCRREVEGGESRGNHAVHFFGEGLGEIAGAQAGFHVADRDALIEGCQGAAERGGGVALDEHEVGCFLAEDGFEQGQDAGGGFGQGLAGLHAIEVVIGGDAEGSEDLIEHPAVLCGDASSSLEISTLLYVE